MHAGDKTAGRYQWHSDKITSFIEEPHTAICGINKGKILNLTAAEAGDTRRGILSITKEKPEKMIGEFQHLVMPSHHQVHSGDVNLKRLGTVLWLAHEQELNNFEELLLLQGVGPRTIQSLTLVSEVIHGTASRFNDPARFSFAHGGKDGNPFPVPTKIFDETIGILQVAVNKAKLGHSDKQEAIRKLHQIAVRREKDFIVRDRFDELVQKEKDDSWKYGGKTVFGDTKAPRAVPKGVQLKLF